MRSILTWVERICRYCQRRPAFGRDPPRDQGPGIGRQLPRDGSMPADIQRRGAAHRGLFGPLSSGCARSPVIRARAHPAGSADNCGHLDRRRRFGPYQLSALTPWTIATIATLPRTIFDATANDRAFSFVKKRSPTAQPPGVARRPTAVNNAISELTKPIATKNATATISWAKNTA